MSNLEKLYYNMEKLSDDWCDMKETREARDKLEKAIGAKLYAKYEDEICSCMGLYEKRGYIQGFAYEVSLLTSGRALAV